MKKAIVISLAVFAIGIATAKISQPVQAQTAEALTSNTSTAAAIEFQPAESTPTKYKAGKFTKKRYSINGGWEVEEKDGKTFITFNENFKTKGGPDLKLYLSPNSLESLSSKSAETGAIKLGVLKSNRGTQTYNVPQDIELSKYKSLIIHCEAFSVLWGGFDLTP